MTFPNLMSREPGAVIELPLEQADPVSLIVAWRRAVGRVPPRAGALHTRTYHGGVALFVTGLVQVLLPLNERKKWAVACAEAELARCDAALITNVSADHLGDYGVDDDATMARVKAVVPRRAHRDLERRRPGAPRSRRRSRATSCDSRGRGARAPRGPSATASSYTRIAR